MIENHENRKNRVFEQVGSESGRLEVASYGRRAAEAAAAAAAAEPPRGSGTKKSKNDIFRTLEAGIPPCLAPRWSVNLADISIDNHGLKRGLHCHVLLGKQWFLKPTVSL